MSSFGESSACFVDYEIVGFGRAVPELQAAPGNGSKIFRGVTGVTQWAEL